MPVPTPAVTLALMAYNQQSTVEAAAASCLAQDCEPIDILLSDDASSDQTHSLLLDMASRYRGPHTVRVNRNATNLGIAGHFNRLVELARGDLVIVAAGDDISMPQRVSRVLSHWDEGGRSLDLIAVQLIDMAPDGTDLGLLRVDDLALWRDAADWTRRRPHVVGAGHAWTRRLFERFGPLHPSVAYEDQVITLRAILGGGAATIDEPLVRYRRGGTSAKARGITSQAVLARLRRENERHLAELAQLAADAARAGASDVIELGLRKEQGRQRYLHDLLASQTGLARLRLLAGSDGVDLAWRWRKFAAVQTAGLTALKHRMRSR